MSKSVFCIATTRGQADLIVDRLQSSGFPTSDISVLLPDATGKGEIGHVISSKASEGIAAGVTTGGLAGGTLGLLAGIGALAIPGLGPFIAAGPIMAALGGAALGAATGGVVGGLIGLGIPEIEARRYEERLKEGNYLISVHTHNGDQIQVAEDVFEDASAEDIAVVSDATVPKA